MQPSSEKGRAARLAVETPWFSEKIMEGPFVPLKALLRHSHHLHTHCPSRPARHIFAIYASKSIAKCRLGRFLCFHGHVTRSSARLGRARTCDNEELGGCGCLCVG